MKPKSKPKAKVKKVSIKKLSKKLVVQYATRKINLANYDWSTVQAKAARKNSRAGRKPLRKARR